MQTPNLFNSYGQMLPSASFEAMLNANVPTHQQLMHFGNKGMVVLSRSGKLSQHVYLSSVCMQLYITTSSTAESHCLLADRTGLVEVTRCS